MQYECSFAGFIVVSWHAETKRFPQQARIMPDVEQGRGAMTMPAGDCTTHKGHPAVGHQRVHAQRHQGQWRACV